MAHFSASHENAGPSQDVVEPKSPLDKTLAEIRTPKRFWVVLFGLTTLLIVGAGYLYYHLEATRIEDTGFADIAAIAEIKIGQMVRWRQERSWDVRRVAESPAFRISLAKWLCDPGNLESEGYVRSRLKMEVDLSAYSHALLTDTEGRILISIPSESDADETVLREMSKAALDSPTPLLSELHRAPSGDIHIDVVMAVRDDKGQPLAVVLLRAEANEFLFPMIQTWPVPSDTAETLLVRRDGDEVLFLNELRHRPNTALVLRQPLSNVTLPATQAVLGRIGRFRGRDYRNVDVLTILRPVPGTTWFMVAKVDSTEILKDLRYRAVMIVILSAIMIAAVAGGTAYVYRTRQADERRIANELLRNQSAHLRETNDELVRFAYTVSHDLKSPLVTIRTFLGYVENDMHHADTAKVASDLRHMRHAAERMSELLDELLELSRVGRKMNPPEDVPLQTLVKEALGLVAGAIAARGAQVQVTDAPIVLHGDRKRLVEVFQNLVDNAVKFMGDQPSPRVEIGIEEAGAEIIFFVRDNGSGIDPRHHSKLFGLFEKLQPESEGTGIGLALVKRIIEVHGGRVWAESAGLGQGSTFFFTLSDITRT